MLDIRVFRDNADAVRTGLSSRGRDASVVDEVVKLDLKHRELLSMIEGLRAESNAASKQISEMKKVGEDADEVITRMRDVREQIKSGEADLVATDEALEAALLGIPNLPDASCPMGASEDDNVEVRHWGEIPEFSFEPKTHWDLGTELGILDFETASKLAGARFSLFRGAGAAMERALISFMIDLHVMNHGYIEIAPPYLATRDIMKGTGQVPAMEEDMFRIAGHELFLIPTAEVPLCNYHAGDILEADVLPVRYTAYTPCFRAEAGAAGKDTKGLIRRHQFDKVEMAILCRPEDAADELEKLTAAAEDVLKALELPYRVLELCTADIGPNAVKTYDPEVWMPGMGRFVEISSCSNCTDYQARRTGTRFRPEPGAKPELVYMLNGSGLAAGRTFAAILENHQQEDGSVRVPAALRPYMNGLERIEPRA